MTVVIRRCTFAEIEASGLTVEYAAESSIKNMPPPNMQTTQYNAMDAAGIIYPMGAYFEEVLIGFITILSPVLPHYGVAVGVVESYFVAKKWRKSGAGHKLRESAEAYAKEKGCVGILLSSPYGGDLAEILPRVGYTETNRVFFKRV